MTLSEDKLSVTSHKGYRMVHLVTPDTAFFQHSLENFVSCNAPQ